MVQVYPLVTCCEAGLLWPTMCPNLMVQVYPLVACFEAGLLWPTMCPTSWYRFLPIIILNKMFCIRSSSCNIEHHHPLRRQNLSIIRYQPNDSGIVVIHALYHCIPCHEFSQSTCRSTARQSLSHKPSDTHGSLTVRKQSQCLCYRFRYM